MVGGRGLAGLAVPGIEPGFAADQGGACQHGERAIAVAADTGGELDGGAGALVGAEGQAAGRERPQVGRLGDRAIDVHEAVAQALGGNRVRREEGRAMTRKGAGAHQAGRGGGFVDIAPGDDETRLAVIAEGDLRAVARAGTQRGTVRFVEPGLFGDPHHEIRTGFLAGEDRNLAGPQGKAPGPAGFPA